MARQTPGFGFNYDPIAAFNATDPSAPPAPKGLFDNTDGLNSLMLGLALMGDSMPRVNPRPTTELIAPMLSLWNDQATRRQQQQAMQRGMEILNKGPPGVSLADLMADDTETSPVVAANPGGGPGGLFSGAAPNQGQMSAGGSLGGGAPGGKVDFTTARQLAQQAGFQGNAADKIAAISLAESSGNPNAHGDLNLGHSWGITQINEKAHGPVAREAYGNPLRAMQLAYQVSKGGSDFSPWTMFKNGGYQKYLPASGSAPADTVEQASRIPMPMRLASDVSPAEQFLGQQRERYPQMAQGTPQTMTDASRAPVGMPAYGRSDVPVTDPRYDSGNPRDIRPGEGRDQYRARLQAMNQGDNSAAEPAQAQPGAAPTMQNVAQARAAIQAPPPPSPQTVQGGTSKQAAALRYYDYYSRVAAAFAPLGSAGAGIVDYAHSQRDLVKDLITKEQEQRLKSKYGPSQKFNETTAEHQAIAPYLASEAQSKAAGERSVTEQSDMRIQQFKTNEDIRKEQALDPLKQSQTRYGADQDIRKTLASQGMMYDASGRIVRIPNWNESNAANKGAEAGAIAGAQLGPKLTEAQVAAKLARENMLAKEGLTEAPLPGGGVRQEPIPGGSAAMAQATQKAQRGLQSALVDRSINRAMELSSHWTTGALGSATKSIPGMPAHDLAQTLDTLKAQSTFENLSQMRQSSPTGGALGAVSDFENRLLGAAWTNLQQSQSKGQFENNLRTLKQAFDYTVNGVPDLREKLQHGEITRDQYHGELQRRLGLMPAAGSPDGNNAGPNPADVPAGAKHIGTYQGHPVYQMPDGSRKMLQ